MKKLLFIIIPIALIVGLISGVVIGINYSSKTEDKSFYSIGLPEGGEYDPNEIIIQVVPNYDSGYNFENQGINFSFSDNESGFTGGRSLVNTLRQARHLTREIPVLKQSGST